MRKVIERQLKTAFHPGCDELRWLPIGLRNLCAQYAHIRRIEDSF